LRALFALACLPIAACASAPTAPPPEAGDCAIIRLWSNGFHTNIAAPASLFQPEHPLRALFPEATHFLIGWGERDYYMATQANVSTGLKAIIPPSRAVAHVIAAQEPVETRIWPGEVLDIAISGDGATRLAAAIANSITLDSSGGAVIEGGGRIEGASAFLSSPDGFHLFNMCNHWTARALFAAGAPVQPRFSFTAGALMKAVRRKTPRACPTD
jgi:uncharacterized protein (TIGR02117 family)